MTPVGAAHPATVWEEDARQQPSAAQQLRLAAMAGHMRVDRIAARRAALIDLLADGRSHAREAIWQAVAAQLGEDCWGRLPREALARDLAALRQGGIRIGYSRRPGIAGYYLQHPRLEAPDQQQYGATNWDLVGAIGELTVPEKNRRAFAAAEFALQQKRLILAEAHPDWAQTAIDAEARRQTYGVTG